MGTAISTSYTLTNLSYNRKTTAKENVVFEYLFKLRKRYITHYHPEYCNITLKQNYTMMFACICYGFYEI